MKQSLLRLSILAMLLTIKMGVFAETFEVNGIMYSTTSSSTVEVTYRDYYRNSYSGDIVIPESVSYNGNTYSVTSIDDHAFNRCSGLTSVTIPNSITSIGHAAFWRCSSLVSLTIPNSVTSIGWEAFRECSNLTSVTISNSVTSIEDNVFDGCRRLTSVTIPNSVTSIGYRAFASCSSLTFVTIGNSVTSIGSFAFQGCSSLTSVTIPNSVTSIGGSAFEGCSILTSVTLPNGVTSIGDYAFYRCISLESVNLPNSLSTLGNSAFRECKNISSIVIPQNITSLSDGLFKDCSSLKSISLHRGITEIGAYCFSYCTSLESIEIPNGVLIISGETFDHCINLKSVFLPQGVTSIGGRAFDCCLHLESLTLPNSLTQIQTRAFRNCKSLKTVNLPNGIKDIWSEAFEGCTSLEFVLVPESIEKIGEGAFANCHNLTLKLMSETPLIINNSIGAISLEVPIGATVNYSKAKYWNDAEKIYAVNNDKKYFPIFLTIDGETVVSMKNGAEKGIEVSENEVVEISLVGELAKYSFIMKGSIDITDTIKASGRYTLYPSIYYRDNMIRTFAYQTKDVHVASSGTLVTEVGRNNIEDLLSLKVSGELNGTDILAIWKMTKLKILDLSDANIVNGGATYYESYLTSEKTIGDYFFKDKENLIRIVLPINTETIRPRAFKGCKRLKSILIPASVKEGDYWLDEDVFMGCDSLESVIVLCPVVSRWFSNILSLRRVTLAETVTKIGEGAFYNCRNLEYVTIPNNVQKINSRAFEECKRLRSIVLPYGLTKIESSLMRGCSRLKTIKIPSSVTNIDISAFSECINLESINLPNSIITIGDNAFSECHSLRSLIIPENANIDGCSFYNCSFLDDLVLPKKIELSPRFSGGLSLKSISFPNGTKIINANAFSDCLSLKSVIIPNSVITIGNSAFRCCEQMTEIKMPSDMTSVNNNAFKGCAKLKTIYSLNSTPPIIEEKTFEVYHYKNATLNVPSNAVSIYWLHPYWENFFNINESDVSSIKQIDIGTTPNSSQKVFQDDIIYNLNGNRVRYIPLGKKGIYIKNGKKILIK